MDKETRRNSDEVETEEYRVRTYEDMLKEFKELAPHIVRARRLVISMYNRLRLIEGMSHKKAKERIVRDAMNDVAERSFYRYLENNENAPHRHRQKLQDKMISNPIRSDAALSTETVESVLKPNYEWATHHLRKREEIEATCNEIFRFAKETQSMAKNNEERSMLLDSFYRMLLDIVLGLVTDTNKAVERLSKELTWKEQEIQSGKNIFAGEKHCYDLEIQMANVVLSLQEKRSEILALMAGRGAC